MKIAVLADIHGNQYAMNAVSNRLIKEKIENIIVLGDIVGYYYRPDIILKQLSKFKCVMIKGNHEKMLEGCLNDPVNREYVKGKYGSGLERSQKVLEQKEIRMLLSLPEKKTIKIKDKKYLLCHGSPWKTDYYIYPDTNRKILERCLKVSEDVVLIGHSHYPFIYCKKNKILVNPGSVGQARDYGGVSNWAVIDTTNSSVVFKKTPYDINKLTKEIKKYDKRLYYLSGVLKRD